MVFQVTTRCRATGRVQSAVRQVDVIARTDTVSALSPACSVRLVIVRVLRSCSQSTVRPTVNANTSSPPDAILGYQIVSF